MADTYYSVINSFRSIIESHPAVQSFRIGPISSVELPDNELPNITYPYIHLVAQPSTLGMSTTIFEFDMIIMDLVDAEDLDLQIRAQSQMLEIGRDIIAKYTMTDWGTYRFNISMPLRITPFVERFINDVSGWTFQVRIEALTPLDNCTNNPIK
ncbi:MAG: hypothetical protein M0P99_00275 [Candidatus Cloacimonetes bacterium]|nr:hypothetical protein [Candidatus Cloacimonadota bacterium]